MKRRCLVLTALTAVCALAALGAVHKMHIEVYVEEGAKIAGEAYYTAQTKVAQAKVEIFAPDGKKLGETKTDDEGKFSFEASYRCEHKFVVSIGGHGGTAVLPAEDLPETLPAYKAEK